MRYSFNVYGHENVRSSHARTMEFTKDADLTLNGDCIVGVRSDFELRRLRSFLKLERVKIAISVDGTESVVFAIPNRDFNSDRELVIRISDFSSERTFAIRSNKAASDLDKRLVEALRKGGRGVVTVSSLDD